MVLPNGRKWKATPYSTDSSSFTITLCHHYSGNAGLPLLVKKYNVSPPKYLLLIREGCLLTLPCGLVSVLPSPPSLPPSIAHESAREIEMGFLHYFTLPTLPPPFLPNSLP